MRGASFDCGLINSAIYVEEFDHKQLLNLQYNKKDKYKLSSDVYEKLYTNGKCVFTSLFSSVESGNRKKIKFLNNQNLLRITQFLDFHGLVLDSCDFFVIEQQLKGRFKFNVMAARVEHHIQSYLLNRYGPFKPVIIFHSKYKTHMMGAPRMKVKAQRKKWCEKEAEKILKLRKDVETYKKVFVDHAKKDDFGDAIMQMQAVKLMIFVTKKL